MFREHVPPSSQEPIDVVYTWVDGATPGYAELLARHARGAHDLNPNRYRDNLQLLKYSLRSLERHVRFVRHVYLVTARPQCPSWLVPSSQLTVVHHDELMPEAETPTFNSFGIVTRLHEIAGLSRLFLYVEDDRLFGADLQRTDLIAPDGRIKLHAKLDTTPAGTTLHDAAGSPWDNALAHSNALLDAAYGRVRRRSIKHAPVLIDKHSFERFVERFAEPVQATRSSRFRSAGNIAPEHMYPHWLLHEGLGTTARLRDAYRDTGYAGLESSTPLTAAQLALLRLRRPKMFCLNDNFDAHPNPRAVRVVRAFLEQLYPEPSRFERAGESGQNA